MPVNSGVNGDKAVRTEDAVLKLFNKQDLSEHTIKLKSPPRKGTKKAATNWKERANQLENEDNEHSPPSSTKSPGPVVTQLDEKDISTFPTGRPLQDEPDYTICKQCKKPIIKTVAAGHIRACLKAKTEKRKKMKEEKAAAAAAVKEKDKDKDKDKDDPEEPQQPVEEKKKGAKKMAKKEGDATKSKKRKADEPKLPKEPKAKKKKEKPSKPDPKPKAPVDVEKQCGVPLPNGLLCARSLTCKSHSMGAKRAVLGRSQPYDVLLAAYQKKNQAKQQKAAINAGAPPPDELEANAIPVDSDEETELVMAAVARTQPRPLEHQILMPVRKKYQYVRMREMLACALKPASLYNNDSGGPFLGGGNSAGFENSSGQTTPQTASSRTIMPGQSRTFPTPQGPQRKGSVNAVG